MVKAIKREGKLEFYSLVSSDQQYQQSAILGRIALLSAEYADDFLEPRDLSPTRAQDHEIVPQPGFNHVNVHSYRYPHH